MADVKFEVTRVALSTAAAGNTQDITISGFGTPKAAIFLMGLGSANDTVAAAGRLMIGFTDGSGENVVESKASDAVGTTNTERAHRTDSCVHLSNAGATALKFSFNSWITDGVRLDIDDATGTGFLVTCILIGGTDVSNTHVGFKDDLGTAASAVDINTVGFEPDLVFMTCTGLATAPSAISAHGLLSFGIGVNDGLDTQRSIQYGDKDAISVSLTNSLISNSYIVGQVYDNANQWDASIGSYDASGFSLTPTADPGSDIVFYLCLKFTGSPDIALFDMEWPTSGNYAETTPSFGPSFGLLASLRNPTARNTLTNDHIGVGIAAFDSTNIYTIQNTSSDGSSTTIAKSKTSDSLRLSNISMSSDEVVASSYAFDSEGWDFTLSTNPASAVLGWGLAIGAGGAAAANPKGPLGHPLHGPFGGPL